MCDILLGNLDSCTCTYVDENLNNLFCQGLCSALGETLFRAGFSLPMLTLLFCDICCNSCVCGGPRLKDTGGV